MKILIITGGAGRERKISLWSAKDVHEALVRAGYEVEDFDLKEGFEKLRKKLNAFDLALPIIHGAEGEGGTLQKKLEDWGVKFLGPSSETCFNGWNKFDFKKFCEVNDINTPKWQNAKRIEDVTIKPPFIIKPSDEGSSFDYYVINDSSELKKEEFNHIFDKYNGILVEEFISGVEVTSGIWGNQVLPLIEIRPPEGETFDYENKYNGKTQEIPFAPSLSKEMQEKVNIVTEKIRIGLKIRDFSRIDYMVRGDEIFALELNTIPGMTSESLLPKAIKAEGMSMEEALDLLIKSRQSGGQAHSK